MHKIAGGVLCVCTIIALSGAVRPTNNRNVISEQQTNKIVEQMEAIDPQPASTQPVAAKEVIANKRSEKYTVENCRKLLDALWLQESGGKLNPPDGDNGKAIGPYQIWYVYYLDACQYDTSIAKNAYHLCRNKDFAEKVIVAYLNRYGYAAHMSSSAEWEVLAKIHNGGPRGHLKQATEKYWQSVKKFMETND